MPRSAIIAVTLALIAAAIGALYWYSRTAAGISMGGPVPLRSVPPPQPFGTTAPLPPPAAPSLQPPAPSGGTASPATAATATAAAASAAPAGPRILRVALSSPEVTGGQIVTGTVQTSPDVTAVSARILGYSSPLTKVSTGYFALSYQVPTLPQFLRRTYTIVVTATNAQGLSASSSLPVRVR